MQHTSLFGARGGVRPAPRRGCINQTYSLRAGHRLPTPSRPAQQLCRASAEVIGGLDSLRGEPGQGWCMTACPPHWEPLQNTAAARCHSYYSRPVAERRALEQPARRSRHVAAAQTATCCRPPTATAQEGAPAGVAASATAIPTQLNTIPHSRETRRFFYGEVADAVQQALSEGAQRVAVRWAGRGQPRLYRGLADAAHRSSRRLLARSDACNEEGGAGRALEGQCLHEGQCSHQRPGG